MPKMYLILFLLLFIMYLNINTPLHVGAYESSASRLPHITCSRTSHGFCKDVFQLRKLVMMSPGLIFYLTK